MKILFVTGNANKAAEAQAILREHGVAPYPLDLPEIQSLDARAIIAEKLRAARERVELQDAVLMVEDTSFWIGDLGFPGPLFKFLYKAVGKDGIVTFARAFSQEHARAECNVGLLLPDSESPVFFVGVVEGSIVEPRGTGGFEFDYVFLPVGRERTFAEMTPEEKNAASHRRKALEQVAEYLNRLDACQC